VCSSDLLCSASFFGVLICHLGYASLSFGMSIWESDVCGMRGFVGDLVVV